MGRNRRSRSTGMSGHDGSEYPAELNPVEHLWDELREKHFHNRAFDSIDALEDHLVDALKAMENNPERVASITRWPWIVNSVSNAN